MTRFYLSAHKYTCILFCLILLSFPTQLGAACQVTLEWDPKGLSPDGYRLYERKESQKYYPEEYFDLGKETICTISKLEDNATYHFVVRAYVGNEEGNNSNEATFSCEPAPKPSNPAPQPTTPETKPEEPKEQPTQPETKPEEPKEQPKEPDPQAKEPKEQSNDTNPPNMPDTISPEDASQEVNLGPTLTTSEYSDPDPEDGHAKTHWKIYRFEDDECIYDATSSSDLTTLEVPPNTLEPFTTYYWTASYQSQSGGVSDPSPRSEFTTTNEDAPAATDSNELASSNDPASASSLGDGFSSGGLADGVFGVGCFIQTLAE